MPMYFFNTVDGRRYPDEDGTDLPDLRSVRRKATLVLAELLREQPLEVWESGRMGVEVTDESGAVVMSLNLAADAEKAA
jgi:hypothetical protein